jgi:hypothetical protein
MLALRSERVMIFAGPCSPRFTADTFVVSVNVGEGGPGAGEALRFPCEFVVIVKGRRGRDFGIWRARILVGLAAAEKRDGKRGLTHSRSLWWKLALLLRRGLEPCGALLKPTNANSY